MHVISHISLHLIETAMVSRCGIFMTKKCRGIIKATPSPKLGVYIKLELISRYKAVVNFKFELTGSIGDTNIVQRNSWSISKLQKIKFHSLCVTVGSR